MEKEKMDTLQVEICRLNEELKRQVEYHRKMEERYALALQGANDGIWDYDIVTGEVYYSPRWKSMLGYEEGDISNSIEEWKRLIHPDDRERVLKILRDYLEGRRCDYIVEHRLRHKDGSYRHILSRGIGLRDEDGQPYRMAGAHTDITALVEREAEILRLKEELEARVKERTADLEAANRELESFSYSVSHDLRAPLRNLYGFSQLLLKKYEDRLEEQGRDYLRRIKAGAERMERLIDDILRLSRISRAEMKRERVDLSAMAKAIINELREGQPERSVDYFIQEGLTAMGDANLLRVALYNLLENAWKYTGKKDRARIEFGAEGEGEPPIFYVRDNGAGFDMSQAQRLFNPFQRLHGETEFGGTGIGLAIVKKVIQRHGGSVWAEGEEDKGATFYFKPWGASQNG